MRWLKGLSLLLWMCSLHNLTVFAKTNCGLKCFRWQKCMGQVDGSSSRPGELGNTGVIVLNVCDEGKCDCRAVLAEKAAEKEAKKQAVTTKATTPSRSSVSRGGSRFSPSRSRTRTRGGSSINTSPAPTTAAASPRLRSRFRPLIRSRGSFRSGTAATTTTTTTTTTESTRPSFSARNRSKFSQPRGLSSSVKEKASSRLASLFASRKRPPKRVPKPQPPPTPPPQATEEEGQVQKQEEDVVTEDDQDVLTQQVEQEDKPEEKSVMERAVITGTSVSFSTSESQSISLETNPTESRVDENGETVHVVVATSASQPEELPRDARSRFRRFFKQKRLY